MIEILLSLAAVAGGAVLTSMRILREYERAVVFRLGRLTSSRGPGLIWLLPFGIERMVKVPLRIVAMDIPSQDVITRDNVSVKVNAVVYFRVADPVNATIVIQDYLFATSQLAQTTLRSVVGQAELDQLLGERENFNHIVRRIIDEGTDPWGIDVVAVEIKDIDLPVEMRRAIARQAEAERERRAKVINAQGELQASQMLAQAASVIQREPAAIQLRYLQTVSEIAAENNSTTLFPIPIDLFRPFIEGAAAALGKQPDSAVAKPAPEPPDSERRRDELPGAPSAAAITPGIAAERMDATSKPTPEPVRR